MEIFDIDGKSSFIEELSDRMYSEIFMLVNDDDVDKRWWENVINCYKVEK